MKSLNIKQNYSEKQKIQLRQNIIKDEIGFNLEKLFVVKFNQEKAGTKNCENIVGGVEIPVGIAGPVKIESELFANDLLFPLATTEGALLASVNRGCRAINEAGSCEVYVKKIGMTRSPVFLCDSS